MSTLTQASMTRMSRLSTALDRRLSGKELGGRAELVSMAEVGFWNQAFRRPERVVVHSDEGDAVTAGVMLDRANRLVHGLRRHGLERGSVVAVSSRNRPELLQVYLAAMQAGWYFLALDPELPPASLQPLLRDASPSVVLTDRSSVLEQARALGPDRGYALDSSEAPSWRLLWEHESGDRPADRSAGERLLYTSGTTGAPRAIRRPLSGLSPEYLARQAALHLKAVCDITPRSDLVHLVASPLFHSASQIWCCDHLQLGHSVVLIATQGWCGEEALRAIDRYRVTGSLMVPTHFRRLLALPPEIRRAYDVSSLRHVVHTGAPCPVSLKQAMLDWWGPVIFEVYGAAEGPGTCVSAAEWLRKPGTVGQARGRVRVLDDAGHECAPGQVGHIHLKLGQAAGSASGFASVGDLGRLDEEGYLFLLGRSDAMLISGGVNVYPEQVEAVLAAHPEVLDVAVVGVPDPEWGHRVEALIRPIDNPGPDLALRLRHWAKSRLAPSQRPRAYHQVVSLPRDANGKLRRNELNLCVSTAVERGPASESG